MNVALIIAGGIGSRTRQYIPKQFISVLDKPIIIYTLEKFQIHQEVDVIEVVCLEGWENILQSYAKQYGIAKLELVAVAGESSQESIYNGLISLKGRCKSEDIIVIHDGIRPMVSLDIITSCIETCKQYGNGISSLPIYEQIFRTDDGETSQKYIPRETLRIVQTPQAYFYQDVMDIYDKGFKEGKGLHPSAYANTLMADMKKTIYFSKGSTKNIKITTADDIDMFKAMLLRENGIGV